MVTERDIRRASIPISEWIEEPEQAPTGPEAPSRRVQLLLWTLPALVGAVQDQLSGTPDPYGITGWRSLVYHLPLWWLWLPLTPLILSLGRAFPVTERRGLHALLVHLPTSLLLAATHLALSMAWGRTVGSMPGVLGLPPMDALAASARTSSLQLDLFAYWAILGVGSAQRVYRSLLHREVENSGLRYRLAQARVRALKTQLQPHFMFNALNAVSTLLLRKDGTTADRMLSQLAEFVRLTLSDSGQEIPLEDDVALAEKYLSIEQVRFEDRLRFAVHLEPGAARALVPQLLLQPVVENAVKHGISPKAKGGLIEIRAQKSGDRVRIEVTDDGAGLPDGRASIRRRSDGGVGLSNTRDRLRHLYGEDFRFELSGARDEGTRVLFDLPYRLPSTEKAPEGEP